MLGIDRTHARAATVSALEKLGLSAHLRRLRDSVRFRGLPRLEVRVERELPHDIHAFTQGLACDGRYLFESTGLIGESSLRVLDMGSGAVVAHRRVEDVWAEGIAIMDDRLVQLTLSARSAYVYERTELQVAGEYSYDGEGWGLCADGDVFVMSNGSSRLTVRSPDFSPIDNIEVTLRGRSLSGLNDLEIVGDDVFANVLFERHIFRISRASGRVTGVADCSQLLARAVSRPEQVLNGIAYCRERRSFFVTGKRWPYLFEVTFQE